MKKTLITIFGIIFSLIAVSQVSPGWKISVIENKDKTPIGYIYHTYAIGTQYIPAEQKVPTGLRLVCSTTYGDAPVIAIYWKDYGPSSAKNNQPMKIVIDEKEIAESVWSTDINLIYKPLSESNDITTAMKAGKTIEFIWSNPGRKRTKFDLKDFNTNYYNFTKICNIK